MKDILEKLEGSLIVLERRGVTLSNIIAQGRDGKLPTWHVKVGGKEHWRHTPEEVNALREVESAKLGKALVVDSNDLVVVDVSEASFIDASVLAALVRARRREVHS